MLPVLDVINPEFSPIISFQQDVKPTQFDHTRKNSLKVNLRGLDEIIGQAIEHLKHRGEIIV